MRFLDLELETRCRMPPRSGCFREALAQAGLIDKLFERFGSILRLRLYCARLPDH